MTDWVTQRLTSLEYDRSEAIVAQNFERLSELLAPELIHIHTRGNRDNRDSYLRYLRETIEILEITRGELLLTELAPTVWCMHGKQTNRARWRGAQVEVIVDSVVSQIWVQRPKEEWKLHLFQATALGVPRPIARPG